MKIKLDISYPRSHAEDYLGVKEGTLTLDELAERLSVIKESPLSVRDNDIRPVPHSKVFHLGTATGQQPYLSK